MTMAAILLSLLKLVNGLEILSAIPLKRGIRGFLLVFALYQY